MRYCDRCRNQVGEHFGWWKERPYCARCIGRELVSMQSVIDGQLAELKRLQDIRADLWRQLDARVIDPADLSLLAEAMTSIADTLALPVSWSDDRTAVMSKAADELRAMATTMRAKLSAFGRATVNEAVRQADGQPCADCKQAPAVVVLRVGDALCQGCMAHQLDRIREDGQLYWRSKWREADKLLREHSCQPAVTDELRQIEGLAGTILGKARKLAKKSV